MLTWNVYYGDFNSGLIKEHNVFDHYGLLEDLGKFLRRLDRNKELKALPEEKKKEAFAKELKTLLMYYYWSKCEWEIIISHWPPSERTKDTKVDVYEQVVLNWDHFLDYAWEHRKELKKGAEIK